MNSYIVLLRGINVGGNNLVSMAELRKHLEKSGFSEPKTILQSGNVVVKSDAALPRELEANLAQGFSTELGLNCDIFVRSLAEWNEIINGNPFDDFAQKDPSHLVVIVLNESPSIELIEQVNAVNTGPETIAAGTNCLYVTYPDGIGDSKLPKVTGWKQLGAHGTGRNWNTVLKLQALARS